MRRGFSLTELVVTLAIMAVLAAVALPRFAGILDWLAVDRAARDVTSALAVARHAAVWQARRTRVLIGPDSLRVDTLGPTGWGALERWPGPRWDGIALEVSNPQVVFGPHGMGWGASNTKVVLRRGSHSETITTSRLGRVKRW